MNEKEKNNLIFPMTNRTEVYPYEEGFVLIPTEFAGKTIQVIDEAKKEIMEKSS